MPADGPEIILNVNDDEATRYALSRMLRQAGYEMWEASSGSEALLLARRGPGLVVLDVELPGIDGFEVCRRLKADPRTAAIPVLQTSATFVSAQHKVQGLESGADGYLAQPVDATELIATVRALLRAQQAGAGLQEAGREWQRTFDAVAESVAILRADGTILRVNRALLILARCTADALANQPVGKVFRDRLGIDDPIVDRLVLRDRKRQTADLRAGDAWYRIVADPMLDPMGRLDRIVLVMTDVTGLRALAEAERRRADELLHDNRRKDEFLAMLAHELRNPLNAIATANALQDQDGARDEHNVRLRSTVTRQVRQLARLIDDLLDVSRLTRGRVQLQMEAIDLKTVLHEVVQMARPSLDARRQPLVVEVPDEPVTVHGDALRLGQAFANLVSNASKFSEATRPIVLTCAIEPHVGRAADAVVRVVDEGMGIEPSRLDAIFEPFIQADQSLARSLGGLGIGLTIARRMLELHNGSLTAHSAGLGTGTEFRATLPMIPTAASATASGPGDRHRAHEHGEALDVLVVEDDEDAADLMEALFASVGHRTRVARDGVAGLAAMFAQPPDVAFIDIGLPRMDGYELARTIRRSEQARGVFLVALTGYGRPEDRARALDAGFDVHLVKPLEVSRVSDLLSARVHRAELSRREVP
ncbi:MAG: response regulator [Luteitalea sp.]